MVDFGTDWSCVMDLDGAGRSISGITVVSQAVARRITTPRGWVIDDQNYGMNVGDYLSQGVSAQDMPRVQAEVYTEILKDERVLNVTVTAILESTKQGGPLDRMKITIFGETAPGPFTLVLSVDAVTTTLLSST